MIFQIPVLLREYSEIKTSDGTLEVFYDFTISSNMEGAKKILMELLNHAKISRPP